MTPSRLFVISAKGAPTPPLLWLAGEISAVQNFYIDKTTLKHYYNFNTQKYAMIRPVVPARKPREKAAGASLRERVG